MSENMDKATLIAAENALETKMSKIKKYAFNGEVTNEMCIRRISICDSDASKYQKMLMQDLSVGDKVKMIIIKEE